MENKSDTAGSDLCLVHRKVKNRSSNPLAFVISVQAGCGCFKVHHKPQMPRTLRWRFIMFVECFHCRMWANSRKVFRQPKLNYSIPSFVPVCSKKHGRHDYAGCLPSFMTQCCAEIRLLGISSCLHITSHRQPSIYQNH